MTTYVRVIDDTNLTPDTTNRGGEYWAVLGGGGGGVGTVTSVGVSGANGIGVSGSPITSSGTIALSLGAITPSSVNASGTVLGSNLSGTNTGDQFIFKTIAVSGQTDIVADTAADTLTLVAGTGISLTTNATTDTLTITNSSTANVTKVGTPVDNQIGVWTGDGTIEGSSNLTFDGTTFALGGVQTITVADSTNLSGLTVTQNDGTYEKDAVFITTPWTGNLLVLENTYTGSAGANMQFRKNSSSPSTADTLGYITFWGNDDAIALDRFAYIAVNPTTLTAGATNGKMEFMIVKAGSERVMLSIDGSNVNGISVGNSSVAGGAYVTSQGNQNLTLKTGNATTGFIEIQNGANNNITAAPNGTGKFTILNSVSSMEAIFDTSSLATTDKTFTFPNKTGIFAIAASDGVLATVMSANQNVLAASATLLAGYSAYMVDFFEIGDGLTFEIEDTAMLEIG